MFNQPEILYLWVSLFLVLCVGLDFYYSKIPNQFIFLSLAVSILMVLAFSPPETWVYSILSFSIIFVIGFLLFYFKILGGGDIKALCVVALFLQPSQIQNFLSYSLVWSATYALIFYIITGQIVMVLMNTIGVYRKLTLAENKIPFTFGIMLGWFSLFTMGVISW